MGTVPAVLLALALTSAVEKLSEKVLTPGELANAPASQLANRILPPQTAQRIVAGRVRRGSLPFPSYRIALWEEAAPDGPLLCKRVAHTNTFSNARARWNQSDTLLESSGLATEQWIGTTYPAHATSATCARVQSWAVVAPHDTSAASRVLNRLIDAVEAAKSSSPLPFEVGCAGENACANPREALANIPLHTLRNVSVPPYSSVTMGPAAPTGGTWQVAFLDLAGWPEIYVTHNVIIYH